MLIQSKNKFLERMAKIYTELIRKNRHEEANAFGERGPVKAHTEELVPIVLEQFKKKNIEPKK